MVMCQSSMAGDLRVSVADTKGRALAETVVYASPVAGSAPPVTGVSRAVIDQISKTFVPLVSVIRTGTEVRFPNSDNIRHSIFSFSPAKVFTSKLYSGKQAAPEIFDKPGMIVLGCNIHDQMVAWVVVVDTPYFGKTGSDGTVLLKDLPPGDYLLRTWYPATTFEPRIDPVRLTVDGGEVRVAVETAGSPLPALQALHKLVP
jgi:plastocyanin